MIYDLWFMIYDVKSLTVKRVLCSKETCSCGSEESTNGTYLTWHNITKDQDSKVRLPSNHSVKVDGYRMMAGYGYVAMCQIV